MERDNGFRESDKYTSSLTTNFEDYQTPIKIRKIELLKSADLPTADLLFFNVNEFSEFKHTLFNMREKSSKPISVRFACIPNKYSKPSIRIDQDTNIEDSILLINGYISEDKCIKFLILKESIGEDLIQKKISGRYFLLDTRISPLEEVIELYKGAIHTDILSITDMNDPNFLRISKKLGNYFSIDKNNLSKVNNINDNEIYKICKYLNNYRYNFSLVKKVIANSLKTKDDYLSVCFEFTLINDRFTFTDVDFK